MKGYKFSKQQVANYLINRSFLHKKAENLETVLNQYSCIQVDPINVVARNHELALWNRVESFKKEDLYNSIYHEKQNFEYWLQLFSIIPVRNYPYISARLFTKEDWHKKFYDEHKSKIKLTLDFITRNGPTSSKDLAHIPKASNLFSWTKSSTNSSLLEYLWDTGKIMIHHRNKNIKSYDLTERIINSEILNKKVSQQESVDWILKASFDYLGVVRKPFLRRCGYSKKLDFRQRLDELMKIDEIASIEVPGIKTKYFVLESQLDLIGKEGKENKHKGLNILPPLDPFVIDRQLVNDFFDFEYLWEAYVPAKKRKFGYYGMPILFNGEIVGQIDLKKGLEGQLEVLNLQNKSGNKSFKQELEETLHQLETFVHNNSQ